jgi:hypothetical protein
MVAIVFLASCSLELGSKSSKEYTLTYFDRGYSRNLTYHAGDEVSVLGSAFHSNVGYHLENWNTVSNGSGTTYELNSTFTMPASDLTLYAIWLQTYSVYYKSNKATSGTVPTDTTKYYTGNTVSVLGNSGELARDDCEFSGWNTSADGNGTNYKEGDTIAIDDCSVVLYAQWKTVVATEFAGGDGSAENPYKIATGAQLCLARKYLDSYFIQTADINISVFCENDGWVPVGKYLGDGYEDYMFQGQYDGNGYTISGLKSTGSGLFGAITKDAVLKNITLKSLDIKNERCTGAIVNQNNGLIKNCSSSGSITNSNSPCEAHIGGLIGINYGTVIDCDSSMFISNNGLGWDVGGIIGENISSENDKGNCGIIKDCTFTGIIYGYNTTGGIVGSSSYGTISNCTFSGSITNGYGGTKTGGIVGESTSDEISSCFSSGIVKTTDPFTGGLIGFSDGSTISNCYVTGKVKGESCVGGLLGTGFGNTTVDCCYVTGNTTGLKEDVGGLIGECYGTVATKVMNSYVSGSVDGNSYVGGLIGNGKIASLVNCYAVGDVTGSEYIGGLIGNGDDIAVEYCYAAGKVTGEEYLGGLIGIKSSKATITDCYYDSETSGQNDSIKGTPKTTEQMKEKSTYSSWDFIDIWDIDEGNSYPTLQWEK